MEVKMEASVLLALSLPASIRVYIYCGECKHGGRLQMEAARSRLPSAVGAERPNNTQLGQRRVCVVLRY